MRIYHSINQTNWITMGRTIDLSNCLFNLIFPKVSTFCLDLNICIPRIVT